MVDHLDLSYRNKPTGEGKKMTKSQQAQKLRNEIHVVSDRINRSLALGIAQDLEDFVVLRGSTEQLIALAESAVILAPKIEMPDVPIATRERNERKVPKDADDNRCRICGNPVVGASSWYIHEDGAGGHVWRNDVPEDEYLNDTYGCHPVGPECAKRLPIQYRTKMEG